MREPWHEDAARFEREQFRAQLTDRRRESLARFEASGRAFAEATQVFGDAARRAADAMRTALANIPPEALAEMRSAGRWPSSARLAYLPPEGT